jgi:hypothetical protein
MQPIQLLSNHDLIVCHEHGGCFSTVGAFNLVVLRKVRASERGDGKIKRSDSAQKRHAAPFGSILGFAATAGAAATLTFSLCFLLSACALCLACVFIYFGAASKREVRANEQGWL